MTRLLQRLMWGGVAVLIAASAAVVFAQDRDRDRTDGAGPGSLIALTTEIHELRLAVEDLAKGQTQLQALTVYLSVQQSRLLQVSTQLDTARKDLDAARRASRELATRLAAEQEELSRTTAADRRADLEAAIRELPREQEQADVTERQAQSRENELYQSMQLEEGRWSELIARLEQIMKK